MPLTVHRGFNHCSSDELERVYLLCAALQIVLDDDKHCGDDDLVAAARSLEGLDEREPDRVVPLVAGLHCVDQVLGNVLQRTAHLDQIPAKWFKCVWSVVCLPRWTYHKTMQ
jgi:hypothetical protein